MARTQVRVEGLEGVLKTLKSLPPEVVSKRGGPVRSALRKGAKVIQDQVKANLQSIILAPNVVPGDSTGLLEKNVVITRGKKPQGQNGETFLVRVRNKRYPKSEGKKPVTTAQVARLLEYGTEKRAPMPFIRPAFDAKKEEAVQTFTTEVNKGIERIVRKLARQNRVRT